MIHLLFVYSTTELVKNPYWNCLPSFVYIATKYRDFLIAKFSLNVIQKYTH